MNKKILFYIIIPLIILSGIMEIIIGFNLNNGKEKIYNYSIIKNADYNVNLKPNKFYSEAVLPAEKYYVSNSISSVDLKYLYNFEGSNLANIKYNYDIIIHLVVNANKSNMEQKEIWTRDYEMLDNVENTVTEENTLKIEQGASIDYEFFNNLVNEYENTYNIKVNACLKIDFNISYDIVINEENTKHIDDSIELKMPIENDFTNIERNYQESVDDLVLINTDRHKGVVIMLFTIGSISIIFGITFSAYLIIKTDRNKYLKKMKYILNNYSDLIVTVEEEPNVTGLQCIKVEKLLDIVNLAQQNRTSIIHYVLNKNNESKLYVILDKYAYFYIVSA